MRLLKKFLKNWLMAVSIISVIALLLGACIYILYLISGWSGLHQAIFGFLAMTIFLALVITYTD